MLMPASRSISRSSSTKGTPQLLRERAAERGLAGAAQPDQRDPLRAARLAQPEVAHQPEHDVLEAVLAAAGRGSAGCRRCSTEGSRCVEQLGQRHAQRARDVAQQQHGRIAFARFELREIALGHAGLLRQRLARHAAALARLADGAPSARGIGVARHSCGRGVVAPARAAAAGAFAQEQRLDPRAKYMHCNAENPVKQFCRSETARKDPRSSGRCTRA